MYRLFLILPGKTLELGQRRKQRAFDYIARRPEVLIIALPNNTRTLPQ